MKITTTRQAKQLIGHEIQYRKKHSSIVNCATIRGVSGKNILIDEFSATDWLWLPDVTMKTIELTEST